MADVLVQAGDRAIEDRALRRTYVVDTSVLLADPLAFERFEENDIVLPLVVISELEAKRRHPELGHMARSALRYLETLRTSHGSLTEPIPMRDGGTLRVVRRAPSATNAGKILALHVQRKPVR